MMLLDRLAPLTVSKQLSYDPPAAETEFDKLAAGRWKLAAQVSGDLGVRMKHFFDEAIQQNWRRVVLIGSDCPQIPASLIHRAFDLLNEVRVVLGPSDDGGYYLVGMSEKTAPIFDGIPWSKPLVLHETLQRLEEHRISFAMLPQLYDIDEVEDLQRLRDDLDNTADAELIVLRTKLSEIVAGRE
jgi:rSAM/selenodomain-associated transferase 1